MQHNVFPVACIPLQLIHSHNKADIPLLYDVLCPESSRGISSEALSQILLSPSGGSIAIATLLNPQRLAREICCTDLVSGRGTQRVIKGKKGIEILG